MYKLVANDNFIDLMVKEIKRSMCRLPSYLNTS